MKALLKLYVLLLLSPFLAFANPCELCTVYPVFNEPEAAFGDLRAAVQLQYDYKGELLENGDSVTNPNKEKTAITTVNFAGSLGLAKDLAFDLNIPVVSQEVAQGTFDNRTSSRETGIGDVSLLLRGYPVSLSTANSEFRWGIRAGAKLPTGDDANFGTAAVYQGSGSVDGLVGTSFFGREDRFLGYFDAQYWLRTEGSNNYQLGNGLYLIGGPAFRLADNGKNRFDLGIDGIFRYLESDKLSSNEVANSGSSSLLVGPAARLALGKSFSARFSYALPVYLDSNGRQLVSDYLLQIAISAVF